MEILREGIGKWNDTVTGDRLIKNEIADDTIETRYLPLSNLVFEMSVLRLAIL